VHIEHISFSEYKHPPKMGKNGGVNKSKLPNRVKKGGYL
jgi:hypothetical protein